VSDNIANFDGDALNRPLPVVSCDAHAGPRLKQDLRPYCPQRYLARFDEYVAQNEAMRQNMDFGEMFAMGREPEEAARYKAAIQGINQTTGHYDASQRLKDMDKDGVVAELNFPTTHNFESEPFIQSDLFIDPVKGDPELLEVGSHIYASWLADWCKQAPNRLLGVVTPPLWDIDKSIKEVEWAAKSGIKGIFLLMPRAGIKRYDSPDWERFWAICAETGLHLHTHAGGPFPEIESHTSMIAMMEIELGGWPARQGLHQLIFAGVFERHPKLKIVFTEQNFEWWAASAREYDSTYVNHRGQMMSVVKRKPSEYMRTNVYIGASFMAPFETEDALRNGYTDNVMWGRDYGHIEGTFVVTDDDDPVTNPGRLSMRYGYAKAPATEIRKMVSDNAIDFYKLDREKLTAIARKMKAPLTLRELTTPIAAIPPNGGMLAFRQVGAWA
jgi:predicted TIM-barrel fold metal-dependent hydrolase